MAAGTHILIDCYGGPSRINGEQLDQLMTAAAKAANATILSKAFHQFGDGLPEQSNGWTGVLILAQSHITVHTWPEHNYASFDVYMCGSCDAEKAAQVIERFDKTALTRRLSIGRGEKNRPLMSVSANHTKTPFEQVG